MLAHLKTLCALLLDNFTPGQFLIYTSAASAAVGTLPLFTLFHFYSSLSTIIILRGVLSSYGRHFFTSLMTILITGEKPSWAPANRSPENVKTLGDKNHAKWLLMTTYQQNWEPSKVVKGGREGVVGAKIGVGA